MTYEIRYGKADVKVYRTHGSPLRGVTSIPESPFAGRENILMAAELEVAVHGTAFLDAYTRGDNRLVVATDTMKNFMHSATLATTAMTLEGWLFDVGRDFLAAYPHMERLTMSGRELPFPAAVVPSDDGDGFATSDVLFVRDRNDRSTASLDLEGGHIRASKRLWRNDPRRLRKQFGQFVPSFGQLMDQLFGDAVNACRLRAKKLAVDRQPSHSHCSITSKRRR